MPRLRSRLVGAAAAAGLACTGLVTGAGPAAAAACSGTTGVTVVIDTGSSISTRCAPSGGTAATALQAVASVVPVSTQPGFVCRIDGYPASDPCVRTPPASAYWAFFHAQAGGSWTYSSQGVTSYSPPGGSVIGFRFGSGQQPGIAPPSAPATSAPTPTGKAPTSTPATSPRTTSASPRATTSPPRASASTPRGTSSATTSAGGGATPSAKPSGSASATPTGSPSSSPSSAADGPATPAYDSAPPTTLAAEPTSTVASGGVGTLLAAGGLLALLAGAAGWFAWRRRSPR
jgi:hypothetical protein